MLSALSSVSSVGRFAKSKCDSGTTRRPAVRLTDITDGDGMDLGGPRPKSESADTTTRGLERPRTLVHRGGEQPEISGVDCVMARLLQ
jgi:hypothetical protein